MKKAPRNKGDLSPSWCVRWAVSSPTPVSRHEIESLWLKGKVTGMFNLTTREQFEACQDFCIELGPRHENTRDTVVELRSQVAKLSEENLILSESLKKISKKPRNKKQQQQSHSSESHEQELNAKIQELSEKVADMECIIQELKEDLKSERMTVRELVSERTSLEKKLENERTFRKKLDSVGGRSWLIPDYYALRRSLINDDDDEESEDNSGDINGNSPDRIYEVRPPDTPRFGLTQPSSALFPFISLQRSLKQLEDESESKIIKNEGDSKGQNESDENVRDDKTHFTSLFSSDGLL